MGFDDKYFKKNKIDIAKRLLRVQFSNEVFSDEELCEIFEEEHSSYEVSVRSLSWENGSWATISNLFDYYLYADEVESFGPYKNHEDAENHLSLASEIPGLSPIMSDEKFSICHNDRCKEYPFESSEVQSVLRASKSIQKLLRQELSGEDMFGSDGNFSSEASDAIVNYINENEVILDSVGPFSDGFTHAQLIESVGLYWIDYGDGNGTTDYFLTELETRFFAELYAIPPYED